LISFTTGSMITAIRPHAKPQCWMSAGPPSIGGYAEIGWAASR
jgi:hypothetical protein